MNILREIDRRSHRDAVMHQGDGPVKALVSWPAEIRGHVSCSFLAVMLRRALELRLEERNESWEWAEVLRGLDELQAVEGVFQGSVIKE